MIGIGLIAITDREGKDVPDDLSHGVLSSCCCA